MKFSISTLPPGGRPFEVELSLDRLRSRMNEGRNPAGKKKAQNEHDIEFLTPPRFSGRIVPDSTGAILEGTLLSRYLQPCARCIEPREREVTLPIHVALKPSLSDELLTSSYKDGALTHDYYDDVGIFYYESDTVTIEPIAQEFLILSLDIFWSPPLDTTGQCLDCGIDSLALIGAGREKVEEQADTPSFGSALSEALSRAKKE